VRRLVKEGYQGVGVDIQRDLIGQLQRAVASRGQGDRLAFWPLQAEAVEELCPTAQERFDAVLLLDTLEHVLDEEQALRAAWAVLHPGGWLFLHLPRDWEYQVVNDEHLHLYRDEDILTLLEQCCPGATFELTKGTDEHDRPTTRVIVQKIPS